MWASHETWIKITANKFPIKFSNSVQAEHDNVIETCLCGLVVVFGQ
jgi:hypothetical protein